MDGYEESKRQERVVAFIVRVLGTVWTCGIDPFSTKHGFDASPNNAPNVPTQNVEVKIRDFDTIMCIDEVRDTEKLKEKERDRLTRLVRKMCCAQAVSRSKETVGLALLLASRLRRRNSNEAARGGAEAPVIATALLLALKTLDDWRIDSVAWLPFCRVPLATLNAMEREFLQRIDYNVYVSHSEFLDFTRFLSIYEDLDYLFPSVKFTARSAAAPASAAIQNIPIVPVSAPVQSSARRPSTSSLTPSTTKSSVSSIVSAVSSGSCSVSSSSSDFRFYNNGNSNQANSSNNGNYSINNTLKYPQKSYQQQQQQQQPPPPPQQQYQQAPSTFRMHKQVAPFTSMSSVQTQREFGPPTMYEGIAARFVHGRFKSLPNIKTAGKVSGVVTAGANTPANSGVAGSDSGSVCCVGVHPVRSSRREVMG
ncbi:hypothetical protein HK100_003499 [Physocladia obscura]|uniref:Cyclin N-terminal domain-containing protein n=1 Tax=Physocladia obscura TaxID=109957 RepID=A0AAD5STY4_9FUNG|nr:hypothetical protein HK100_003499 [Physocladia obscura]